MKYIILLLLLFPASVFAHAAPTTYAPAHGAILEVAPMEVRITFSDHIAPASASLILYSAAGTPQILSVAIDAADTHTVFAPLPTLSGGATLVWGVTSEDDGHYTHGAFNFSVGVGPEPKEFPVARLLYVALCVLLVLRIASHFYFERVPRRANFAQAYTLLEALIGMVVLILIVLFFVRMPPTWEKEVSTGGVFRCASWPKGAAILCSSLWSAPSHSPIR